MADNTTLNAGSGGDTIRTDDIGGVKVPVSKIMLGGDGLDLGFVSGSNPFPTQTQSGSISALMANGVIVSPTNPLPAQLYSGSQTGILMGANPVANSNPLAVSAQSGSQTGILVGANPAAQSNPLPTRPMSGSQTGILMGANPVDHSNPLAVTAKSGSQTGILVGANPVASTNPLPVQALSGSQVGILVHTGFGGTQPVALSNPLPVGQAAHGASTVLSGSTYVIVHHAFGDPATSGSANQLIAPLGGNKRIAVLSLEMMCLAATNVRFVSTGSAGTITNISNKMYLPANGGVVLPHNPHAWFKTAANEGLNLDLSAANAVGITLTWTVFNN